VWRDDWREPPRWVATQSQTFYPNNENFPEVHRAQLRQAAQNQQEKEKQKENRTKHTKAQRPVKRRPKVDAGDAAKYIEQAMRSAQPGRTVGCRCSVA
jgi:hypothetical protein